jgi:hypothetical protein
MCAARDDSAQIKRQQLATQTRKLSSDWSDNDEDIAEMLDDPSTSSTSEVHGL